MDPKIRIIMNYNMALAQADELEKLASQICSIGEKELTSYVRNLQQVWQGENSSVFVEKGLIMSDKITRNGKYFAETAVAIRRTAKAIYDAEMYALEVSTTRTYG